MDHFIKNICKKMGDNMCINLYLKELINLDKNKYKYLIERDEIKNSIRKYGHLSKGGIHYIIIKFKKRYRYENKLFRINENNNKYIDDLFLTECNIINRHNNELIYKIMHNIIRYQLYTI